MCLRKPVLIFEYTPHIDMYFRIIFQTLITWWIIIFKQCLLKYWSQGCIIFRLTPPRGGGKKHDSKGLGEKTWLAMIKWKVSNRRKKKKDVRKWDCNEAKNLTVFENGGKINHFTILSNVLLRFSFSLGKKHIVYDSS